MKPLNIPGIDNGYKVDEHVWRGAQPDDAAFQLLAKAGCKAVIDLNTCDFISQWCLAQNAGMYYVPCAWSRIVAPSQQEIAFALGQIDACIGHESPVFIHCQHGSDRTGVLCAIWRMHHDKWTYEQAMHEAFFALGTHGMHEFWMATAVKEYARMAAKA